MKKMLLSPFFALALVVVMGGVFFGIFTQISYEQVYSLTADWGVVDTTCILLWLVCFYTVAWLWVKGKIEVPKIILSFILILLMCTVVREMGIQHCLTTSDTTPFKINFFKKPTNPLGEKIIFGSVLLSVIFMALFLIGYYFKKLWYGFWRLQTPAWTFATFGGLLVVSKVLDRLPSRLVKSGVQLSDTVHSAFSWFEETSEILLPVLLLILLFQIVLTNEKGKK